MDAFIDQSPSDVRYAFAPVVADLDQFNVVCARDSQLGDFSFTAAILTESHALLVTKSGQSASEICACVEFSLPNTQAAFLHEMPKPFIQAGLNAINYQFTYEHYKNTEAPKLLQQLTQEHSLDFHLYYIFPTAFESTDEAAATHLHIRLEKTTLVCETIHTYPNHQSFIYTKSEWS